ncbi:uncharacterized protein J3R85_019230 [Psidium guajava]|nr:uncharacterized protein J3R85_019230 [Psidium guajava]
MLLEQIHSNAEEAKALAKFSDQVIHIAVALDKLATRLWHHASNLPANATEMSNVDEDSSDPEESEEDALEEFIRNHVFKAGKLRNYTLPKPNRVVGKKTFLGIEVVNPSIGMACAAVASNLDRFMSYKLFGTCPDDWDLAQKLMISGCDPLHRRRCFSRTPPNYTKPMPSSSFLWTQPRDVNMLWSHYKCKDYQCLLSNQTGNKRGFFKCSDCFDLSKRGWEAPASESEESAELNIDQVLALKPGEIRVGLDFGPSTGSFAALMRERNVTVATATLNLGAPFNEVIALRGLLPLYISVGSRLPFFDSTLDMVHSSLFLDGWVGVELLQFVLFDWDRVLRPRGCSGWTGASARRET